MKLVQKIAIGFYKIKIKSLGLVSTQKAAQFAFQLFCTPYSGKPNRPVPPIFEKAAKISFELNGLTLRGWHWIPEQRNGKKILIIHGFDSSSYRFEKYIVPLKKAGFEVVAFDAPGHGISDGKYINALLVKQAIFKANAQFGGFYGAMAHSLGGLAAALAAEEMALFQKMVLIAPATESSRAVDKFVAYFKISARVREGMEQLIVRMGNHRFKWYSVRRAIANTQISTLWLHDEEDAVCPFEDVVPVQAMQLPHVRFYITKGLGHSKIYRDAVCRKAIIGFLAAEVATTIV